MTPAKTRREAVANQNVSSIVVPSNCDDTAKTHLDFGFGGAQRPFLGLSYHTVCAATDPNPHRLMYNQLSSAAKVRSMIPVRVENRAKVW